VETKNRVSLRGTLGGNGGFHVGSEVKTFEFADGKIKRNF